MKWTPKGYGGERRSAEEVKREGSRDQGLLVVNPADPRLTWPERELGEKLYGVRTAATERRDG